MSKLLIGIITGFLGATLVAQSAPARTLELNSKRLVEIIDIVDMEIVGQAQQVHKLAQSEGDIDILFNSPGGNVLTGYMFADALDAARESGHTVRCAVGILAASMAFNLLSHCDEVYALRHAALLFHPPRISSRQGMTAEQAEQAAEELHRIVDYSAGEIQDMMGISDKVFWKHFNAETMWTASDLLAISGHKWLTIVDDIQGSKQVFTFQKPRFNFLFGQVPGPAGNTPGPGYTITHISPIPSILKGNPNVSN